MSVMSKLMGLVTEARPQPVEPEGIEASDWAKTVERRFELWARNAQECDIQGLRSFGQMQAAAFRSWLVTGEILAELPWRKRPWNRYGTKVRLLPPQRLSRKTESMKRHDGGCQPPR